MRRKSRDRPNVYLKKNDQAIPEGALICTNRTLWLTYSCG